MIGDEKTLRELGWPDLLAHLADACHTDAGRRAATDLLPERDEVALMLERVTEARGLHEAGHPLPFGSIFTIDQALKRLAKEGSLAAETLVKVAQTLRSIDQLRRFLRRRGDDAPRLHTIATSLTELEPVWGPIADAFDETGLLADHASDDLGRLRRRASELHNRLTTRMKGLLDSPTYTRHLQDRFYTQRGDRYVLPLRAGSGAEVKGIVLGSSSSGATLFVEPQEVVELNNQLKVAETEVRREEARILAELSGYVQEELPAIHQNLELVTLLDQINARARLAIKTQASCPQIADDGALRLRSVRHPLMVLAGVEVVPNDLLLRPGQSLIVSGPNAGGKTVFLKAAGLCALMLRAGLHLPVAPDSRLPLFEEVLTDIDDDQSIERNLSTFTAHVQNMVSFIARANANSLVLLDEIATGTDPGEGVALAQAMLERLADSRTLAIVTTHYERLKALALTDDRFANASVGFDFERLQPTFRLHPDLPGSSCALAVARRVGLAAELAERAEALMAGEDSDLARLLDELGGKQTELETQRDALARAEQVARGREREYADKLEVLRHRGKQQLQRAHQEALTEIKEARAELQRVRAALRREASRERLKDAERLVSAAAARIAPHEPRAGEPPGLDEQRPVDPARLKPGVSVYVERLGGLAEVLELHTRGRLTVRRGSLRAQVTIGEVRLPSKRERRRARRDTQAAEDDSRPSSPARSKLGDGPRPKDLDHPPVRTPDITLDARGMRVDEALDEADKFVDRALLADSDVLYIVHGYGSGALRGALRAHLSHSDAIRDLRAGRRDEGGDAVTVLWLR